VKAGPVCSRPWHALGIVAGLLSLLLTPACGSTPAGGPPTAVTRVRVGLLGSASDAGIYLAQEKGFFTEQGLDLELEKFDTGAQMTPVLGSGRLDVGAGSPSAGLYNAVGRGIGIKIVADKGSDARGFGYQGIALRKDLAERVKDYRDLKGLKVGVSGTGGTSAEIVLAHALRKGGWTMKDINVLPVPYPDMNLALRNGSIDAAVHFEPLFSVAVQQGIAVDWKRADEIYPGHQSAAILYGAQFARDQPEVAKRWMLAYVKGVRYYNDAFRKGLNKAEVIQILARQTKVKPEVLERAVPVGLNPDGYVNFDGLADDLRLLRELGYIKEAVDIKQLVDNQYADFAVKQLGRYKK